MKKSFLTVSLLLLAAILSACAVINPPQSAQTSPPPASAAAREPALQPTPQPTPEPLPTEDEILSGILKTDVLDYIPADTYEMTEAMKGYAAITQEPEKAYALEERYSDWLKDAADGWQDERCSGVSTQLETPGWPLLATLAYNYAGDPEALRAALTAASDLTVKITPQPDGGSYAVELTASPKNPPELFYSLPAAGTVTPLSNSLSYAYLATVFDEEMNVRDGVGTPELEALLFPIQSPENYYFVDCWYDDRDGGARRHTGTDINAPEGTDLLACVDGTILDAGSGPGTGNYIVVQGGDGTQYHYYHMVEPSALSAGTPVKTGDVVGHVGNTGNSTANHLHFTIVTQDGHYPNPYTYLKEAQERALSESGT